MVNSLRDLLQSSLDRTLSFEEHQRLQHGLLISAELWEELECLKQLRFFVQANGKSSFKPFFVEKVLAIINRSKYEFADWLLWMFRRITIVSALMAGLLMYYRLSTREVASAEQILAGQQTPLEQYLQLEDPLK